MGETAESDNLTMYDGRNGETEQVAYELWVTGGKPSAPTVYRKLRDLGHDVSERTVYRWAERWPARSFQELQAILPIYAAQLTHDSLAGSLESIAYWRSIVTDPDQSEAKRESAAQSLRGLTVDLLRIIPTLATTPPQPTPQPSVTAVDPASRVAELRRSLPSG